MAASIDILLGSDGDLPIEQNNFTLGASDDQHIQDCIKSAPGWWKQFAQYGVGIMYYLKTRIQQQTLLNKITEQLQDDGYSLQNPKVSISGGIMQVELYNPSTNTYITK